MRRALLSVSDKRGLVDFARGLAELEVEIISTGGTARELAAEGIEARPVEDYTGFPEILDGQVKTLNPRIHAGILAVRSDPEHVARSTSTRSSRSISSASTSIRSSAWRRSPASRMARSRTSTSAGRR